MKQAGKPKVWKEDRDVWPWWGRAASGREWSWDTWEEAVEFAIYGRMSLDD